MKIRDSKLDYKKLIIALIYIIALAALICISMKIYNNSKVNKPTGPYSMVSQIEKDIYNSKIARYTNDSDGVKGSEIKSMIDNIISMNQENLGKDGKFVGVIIEKGAITDYENEKELLDACKKVSVLDPDTLEYIEKDISNAEIYVKNVTGELKTLKNKIKSKNNYIVEAEMAYGIIFWVKIAEIK